MDTLRNIVRRARERKLVQWALAYLAGAWALAEGVELVGSQFDWPVQVRQGATLILGMGFFAVLVLAWYHGEKGHQRVTGPELLVLATLFAITGLLLAGLDGESAAGPPAPSRTPVTPRERPAVAVLPFTNISGDSIDRFFTDGIHEEIIARLSRVSGLDVIARTSVMRFRDHARSAREIARELNVNALLEGSVRRAGERVRIGAELIDGETQVALWSRDWDRELTPDSIFEVQEEIAGGVAAALNARLTRQEASRLGTQPTHDLEAYDYYLLGRERWRTRSPGELREALSLFDSAIREDPTYALAYAGIADIWAVRAWYDTVPPAEAYPRARQAAEQALALDPQLALAHATLGLIAHEYDWDWAEAERRFRRAIELRPNYAAAHHWYAILLSNIGRHEQAIREGERALQLDPLSPVVHGDVAGVLWTAGRTEAALDLLDRARATGIPVPLVVELEHALILLYEARWDEAAESLERWAGRAGFEDPRRARIIAAAVRGDRPPSEGLDAIAAIQRTTEADAMDLIPLYALLGDRPTALDAVERAFEGRSPWVVWMGTLPWYDSLRAEPRLRTLLDQAGLPNGR